MKARAVSLAFTYGFCGVAAVAVALAPLPRSAWLLLVLAGAGGAIWDRLDRRRIPNLVLTAAGLCGFFASLLPLQRETLAEQSLTALTFLLAVKLLGVKRRRDHLQVLAVSLMLVAGSASLEPEIGFAALLLAAIVLGVLFLLWIPFSEKIDVIDAGLARRLGFIGAGLVIASVPIALLIFVVLPRSANPFWTGLGGRPRAGITGVSEQLQLGDIGRIALSGDVAFRAEIDGGVPLPGLPYWRGAVLEVTNGRRWTVSGRTRPPAIPPADGAPLRITYFVEPHGDRQLFLLESPLEATIGARRQLLGAARVLRLPWPLARRIRYRGTSVWADQFPERLSPAERDLNLLLPATLPTSIRELARSIAGSERDASSVARRFMKHFSSGYTYSLRVPAVAGDPLEAFLLHERTGYCEYFAAGLAVLLRAAGIPARIVSGYLGGDYVPAGAYYLVTQAAAHAWVEAYFDGAWMRLDPTPAAGETGATSAARRGGRPRLWLDTLRMRWNSWVIQYDAESQLELARSGAARARNLRLDPRAVLRGLATALLVAGFTGGLIFLRRRRRISPLLRRIGRFESLAARAGSRRLAHEGPLDHAARFAAAVSGQAEAIRGFGALAAACRYGGRAPDGPTLERLDALLAPIQSTLPPGGFTCVPPGPPVE